MKAYSPYTSSMIDYADENNWRLIEVATGVLLVSENGAAHITRSSARKYHVNGKTFIGESALQMYLSKIM